MKNISTPFQTATNLMVELGPQLIEIVGRSVDVDSVPFSGSPFIQSVGSNDEKFN